MGPRDTLAMLVLPWGPLGVENFGPANTGESGLLSKEVWPVRFVYPEDLFQHGPEGEPPRYSADVLLWSEKECSEFHLNDVGISFPRLVPLAGTEVLLVGGREPTGHVYSSDGVLLRRFHAGYEVQALGASLDGAIWIGFYRNHVVEFDAATVVRLSSDSEIWRYNQERGSAPSLYDCETLNVDDDDVWITGEHNKDLIRVSRDGIQHWTIDGPWFTHVIVAPPRLMFLHEERTGLRAWVGHMGVSQIEGIEEVDLMLPDGTPLAGLYRPNDLSHRWCLTARGGSLRLVIEEELLRFDL